MNTFRLAAAVALLSIGVAAQADSPFQHPATGARAVPANRLVASDTVVLVGHPASPRWKRGHGNAEHPALAIRGAAQGIDANHFLVQPPASAHWALASEPVLQQGVGAE